MKCRTKSILFFGVLHSLLLATGLTEAVTVTVNPRVEHQIFEGWGTSICWWGNIIPTYPEQKRDSIMDLLFDTANGLGLSIIRYNIGGGDDPSHNHMGIGKMMEGFKASATAPYDWTKDAGQRWVVEAAKQRIPSQWFIAEAFSNSPPYWMTVSGCASGATNGRDNLRSEYYTQFADYLTEVVKQFRDRWGVSFRTLEPLNEPSIEWTAGGGQEGCYFSDANQARLIREVKAKLDEKQLETEISALDGPGYWETFGAYNSYDATTRSYISQINTHGYWGGDDAREALRSLAQREGKRLWQSECDGSGAPEPFDVFTHNNNDIVPGIDIANRIIRDLRVLQANAWIFWQAVESKQAQVNLNKNWGLIQADFNGNHNYYITKKFHVFRQYSNFIRPFSRMIDINNNDAVACLSPEQDRLIIVQRNASNSAVSYDYRLTNFQQIGPTASVWRSSATENFQKVDDLRIENETLSAVSPARSVTTYVIPLINEREGNLVRNGDFSSESEHWTLNVWGGSATGSVNNGEFTITIGSTATNAHDIQLIQNGLFLQNERTYRVSFDAYAAADRTLEVNMQRDSDPWTSYLPDLQHFNLTTAKRSFTFTFTMEHPTDANGRISFNVGTSGEAVSIDNVSVELSNSTAATFQGKPSAGSLVNTKYHNSALNVEFTAPGNRAVLGIYNLRGKKLKSIVLKTRSGAIYSSSHDLSNLPAGHYIVKIGSGQSILHTSMLLVTK